MQTASGGCANGDEKGERLTHTWPEINLRRRRTVPQAAVDVVVLHLEIGQSGIATRVPIHHVSAAIDRPAFEEPDECFGDGAREFRAQREALAAPVATVADAFRLPGDAAAVFFLPPASAWRCRRDPRQTGTTCYRRACDASARRCRSANVPAYARYASSK